MGRVRVWDLPTRLFHWALLLLVAFSFVSGKAGGAWLDWHFRSGYAILTLLYFRLLWGFAGSRYARFATFVRGPRAIASYLRGESTVAGHNPLGALSVVAILLCLLLQGSTGLFATDDIASEGPLAKLVSHSTSSLLSRIHRLNEVALVALVAIHVAAVLYHLLVRHRNLIVPMLTGDQEVAAPAATDDRSTRLRAAVLFAAAAALVAYLVNL